MDSYFPTTSDIIGIVLSEIMSIITDKIKDYKKTKEIEARLKNGIETILGSEENNSFYNDLCAVINNSHIIADCVSRCFDGEESLEVRQRVADYSRIKQYDHSREQYFYGVFLRIQKCIEEILRESLDSSDKLLLHFVENNYRKFNNVINESNRSQSPSQLTNTEKYKPINISNLEGHNIPDTSGMALIKRSIHSDENTIVDPKNNNNLSLIFEQKHIIISGEAGSGKTYILYQLFEEASANGIHLIYYSLPLISSNNTLEVLEQGDVELDTSTLILLDGYDELSEDRKNRFLEILSSVSKRYSDLLIVITSRGNAIDERLSSLEYKACHLSPLSKEEICNYLDGINISSSAFLQQVEKQDLSEIYVLPFYLRELANMWIQKGTLPSKSSLMRTIVQTRVQSDSNRYSKTQIRLQQDIITQTRSLERIAHIMLCVQKQQLTESELNEIFSSNESILEYYGLWVKSSEDTWCFSHNIFREYFAAVSLSRLDFKSILSYITNPDAKSKIRPSWYNVVGFLLSECYVDDKAKFDSLLSWLIEHDLYALMFCETDKVSEDVRSSAFIEILNCYKNDNTNIDSKLIKDKHFSVFTNTAKTIEYISQELTAPISAKQKSNLLKCLALYDQWEGYENRITEILGDIILDSNVDNALKTNALEIIILNKNIYRKLQNDIYAFYIWVSDLKIKIQIIRLWISNNDFEDHLDIILRDYVQCFSIESRDDKAGYGFRFVLSHILPSIRRVSSAELLLKYYISHTEMFEDFNNRSLIPLCCSLAISAYDDKKDCNITSLILQLISIYYILDDEDWIHIQHFMTETNSEDLFLNKILSDSSETACTYILGKLMCVSLLSKIRIRIREGRINFKTIEDIIQSPEISTSYRLHLLQTYCSSTGKKLTVDFIFSAEETRKKKYIKYINALFDLNQYEELIRRISMILGENTLIKDKGINIDCKAFTDLLNQTDLFCCWLDLTSEFNGNDNTQLKNCLSRITDWDFYRLKCLTRLFGYDSSLITLSDSQRSEIEEYVLNELESFNYDEIIVDGNTLNSPQHLPELLKAMRVFDINCPSELAIKLISIPLVLFGNNIPSNIYPNWLLNSLSKSYITNFIITKINNKSLNSFNSVAYIMYCIDNNIRQCKSSIIEYILDPNSQPATKRAGIEYIAKLFGINTLQEEILPFCSDDLVPDIIDEFPTITTSNSMNKRLWNIYDTSKNLRCLIKLIEENDSYALEEYYILVKNTPNKFEEADQHYSMRIHQAISHIIDPSCMDILINLFLLTFGKNFEDQSNISLRTSCSSALLNISKCNYDLVVSKLEQKATSNNSYITSALNELLHSIHSEHIYYSDTQWSFEEAINIVPQ